MSTVAHRPVTTLTTNPHNRSLKTTRWWGHKWSPGWAEEGHQAPVRMMSSLLLLVLASTVTCYCPPSCSCNDTRWQRFLEILSCEYFPSQLRDSDSE